MENTTEVNISRLLHRSLADDSGQDVVEYALLAAVIGISAVLIWQQVGQAVADAYTAADADVQGLCSMPNPDGTPAQAPHTCGP